MIISMKVLVIGFGPHSSGVEAAEFYNSYGHEVTLYEQREEESYAAQAARLEEEGITVRFEKLDASTVRNYDILVKAPTIPLNLSILRNAKEITNDLAALLKHPAVEKMKIVIIVGSKGKTSVASALVHALNLMGARAAMCGSIGVSGFHILKDIIEKGDDVYTHLVLEMTNWQISDTDYFLYSRWPTIDCVLLTRQADSNKSEKKEVYKIFGPWVKKALVYKDAKQNFLTKVSFNKKNIIFFPTVWNPYKNREPLESAYEVLKTFGCHKAEIAKAFSSYKGIPHRMEHVALKNGILYINDSAATLPESVLFTMKMIGQASIHLICGGSDKNNIDPTGMRYPFKMATTIILLNGTFSDKLAAVMDRTGRKYLGPYNSMDEAVDAAKKEAEQRIEEKPNSTQIILLAPGSPGYGMFDSEFDRGDKFKDAVKRLG